MCNDFGNEIPYSAYVEGFSEIKLPVLSPLPKDAPNLEPRDEIWPRDPAPVIRPFGAGVELLQLPWGWAPARPKAPIVINLRAEGRGFARGRCLVPASHYFEFTGRTSPKTRWKFTRVGEAWFCFAGLVGRGGTAEAPAEAFTLLTLDAAADYARYHDRQPVILDQRDWAAWLDPDVPAGELLKPASPGSLLVVETPREQRAGSAGL